MAPASAPGGATAPTAAIAQEPGPDQVYGGSGQNHGGAGQVYGGPGEVYGGPGEVYGGPGEVYGGNGQVYGGPDPGPGDVYQGPGDVYQGPGGEASAAGQSVPVSAGAIPDEADMVKAALFGTVAAVASTGLWYALATSSGKMRISTVVLVGFLIGFGTSWGAGRRGEMRVVGLSVGLFLASMVFGQFLINNYFYKQFFLEEQAYGEATAGIVEDGDYTPEEARVLIGFSEDEWDEMSLSQQEFWIASIESEYYDETEDGWDPDDGADGEDYEPLPASIPLGEFLVNMPAYFGIWGFICLVFGGVQAYKFPAGFDD